MGAETRNQQLSGNSLARQRLAEDLQSRRRGEPRRMTAEEGRERRIRALEGEEEGQAVPAGIAEILRAKRKSDSRPQKREALPTGIAEALSGKGEIAEILRAKRKSDSRPQKREALPTGIAEALSGKGELDLRSLKRKPLPAEFVEALRARRELASRPQTGEASMFPGEAPGSEDVPKPPGYEEAFYRRGELTRERDRTGRREELFRNFQRAAGEGADYAPGGAVERGASLFGRPLGDAGQGMRSGIVFGPGRANRMPDSGTPEYAALVERMRSIRGR